MTEPEWFSRVALTEWLDLPPRTLEQLDYEGRGPRRYKVGRQWRYRRSDVEKWLAAHADEPSTKAS
jgi:Helix-turn-helix domain